MFQYVISSGLVTLYQYLFYLNESITFIEQCYGKNEQLNCNLASDVMQHQY